MKTKSIGRVVLFLTLPISVLVIIVSLHGIFSPDAYLKETFNWKVQSRAQDIVDLLIVLPVLIISGIFSFRQNKSAILIWAGAILYLLYTFMIYCFNIHFNQLFLMYCFILGLAFYSFIYIFYSQLRTPLVIKSTPDNTLKTISIYFLILPFIFYFMWLSEIISATIANIIPNSLEEVGLFTNPVHIIDLSVFLPGIFTTGIMLLRGKLLGYILSPILLTFFVLMDITIGFLTYAMHENGLFTNPHVIWIMGFFSLVSFLFLIMFFKAQKKSESNNAILIGKYPSSTQIINQ